MDTLLPVHFIWKNANTPRPQLTCLLIQHIPSRPQDSWSKKHILLYYPHGEKFFSLFFQSFQQENPFEAEKMSAELEGISIAPPSYNIPAT